MSTVSEFRSRLANRVAQKSIQVRLWRGGTRASEHLLELGTKPKLTVLYVKESNSSPGFWGLTKNQIDRLDQSSVRWFTVLIARSDHAGYVLSGGQVKHRVRDAIFELSHNGDHTVNEGSDLTEAQAFHDLDELLARVL